MPGKPLGPNIRRLIMYRMSKGEESRKAAVTWVYHTINVVRVFLGSHLDDEQIAQELLKHRPRF